MASDASMNHAGRVPGHDFRDLRSARRAQNRTRSHKKKYWNFRSITPADLPSSPSQQLHYVPVCGYPGCPTQDKPDNCIWNTFPANLSTAPVARFTKREAFKCVQWDQPPKYHRSRKQNFPNWRHQRDKKHGVANELRAREWFDDIWGWFGEMEAREDILNWWNPPCPCDDHIDWYEWPGDKIYGCTWDDYTQDENVAPKTFWSPDVWLWHRHVMGGWFRSSRECEKVQCACVCEWDEPVCWEELDEWWFSTFPPERDGEVGKGTVVDIPGEVAVKEDEVVLDDDWDVVSNASTEAWTQLELVELDVSPYI